MRWVLYLTRKVIDKSLPRTLSFFQVILKSIGPLKTDSLNPEDIAISASPTNHHNPSPAPLPIWLKTLASLLQQLSPVLQHSLPCARQFPVHLTSSARR